MNRLTSVLIIVENLPVPFDRRVWMEATTLQRAGYDVSVICPTGKGHELRHEVVEGVHIYRHPLPAEGLSSLAYLREYATALIWEARLARRVWRERSGFGVIHLCNPPDILFLVALPYRFRGVRVIFDQHDVTPEMYEAKYERRDFFFYLLRFFERLTYLIADVVISTNESYQALAVRRGSKHPDDVHVVRSGPDLTRFQAVPRNSKYLQGRRYLVGYVGVIGETEGIDELLRAVRYIVHELNRRDVQFMVVGGGPMAERMRALADELDVIEHVDFPGRVPDDELLARLSSCDVCVNPDRKTVYTDKSTMNKVLEYMALGVPIVQFDLTEGRKSAGDASLYARPGDVADFGGKILALLDDPERRLRMGAHGRRRMEDELEWRHQAPRLLAAYARLFSRRARPSSLRRRRPEAR